MRGDKTEVNLADMPVFNVQQTVQRLEDRLKDEADSVESLNAILLDKNMQALLKVHESVKPVVNCNASPVCKNSVNLVNEVHLWVDSARKAHCDIPEELNKLLSLFHVSPHLMALLLSHDQIATKDFEPALPELAPSDMLTSEEDESMKVVRLVKGNEPLGATIAVDGLTNNIVIARILKGGAADRSGLIHVNDVLVEVNKVSTRGKKPEELISLLANFRGPLTFCLIPGEPSSQTEEESDPPLYIRAKVDYNPQHDRSIPCAEAGLYYRKNDVLRVVSRDDESWWQASVVEEGIHSQLVSSTYGQYDEISIDSRSSQAPTKRAGLIPSANLQNRRDTLKRLSSFRSNSDAMKASKTSLTGKTEKRSVWFVLQQSFSRPKGRFDYQKPTPDVTPEHEAYEEVALHPPAGIASKEDRRFRPFVLVGPQGVGRNLLKDRLIDSNPSHYGVPIPHTSRTKLDQEVNGKDYHFVTRDHMEQGIRENQFLEYGEYKGNLYGTSLTAVRDVIASQQVCVLTPYPQALKLVYNAELKPFVVFVRPPAMDNVIDKQMNPVSGTKLTIDRDKNSPFSVGELQDLINRGEKIHSAYSHYLDYTIVNDNIERAFIELKRVAFAVENEPQWIPKAWLK